jgi:transcriptional regulator with XRE-family HTH domain
MKLRLREVRQRKGLSIRGLAAKAKVGFSTVYMIEAGKRAPRLQTLERLAKALGVQVTELLAK